MSALIAYADTDAGGNQQVFRIAPDGSGRTQMTTGTGGRGLPAVSPNGAQLVYGAPCNAPNPIGLWSIPWTGGTPKLLASQAQSASWSPDGHWIAYSGWSPINGQYEIWKMKPDGSGKIQLTNDQPHYKVNPTWSPDSAAIAYAQYNGISPPNSTSVQIWVMDANGGSLHQITSPGNWVNVDSLGNVLNTANDTNIPEWDRVSGRIAFWAGVEGQEGQIWTMNLDGSNRNQTTHLPGHNDEPAWSVDGTRISFSTDNQGPWELWTMNPDGSGSHGVTSLHPGPFAMRASWRA